MIRTLHDIAWGIICALDVYLIYKYTPYQQFFGSLSVVAIPLITIFVLWVMMYCYIMRKTLIPGLESFDSFEYGSIAKGIIYTVVLMVIHYKLIGMYISYRELLGANYFILWYLNTAASVLLLHLRRERHDDVGATGD